MKPVRQIRISFFVTVFTLLSFPIAGFAQEIFRGKVVDLETSKPIAYCSIAIDGSARGTISNEEGYFELPADNSEVIVISFLGYEKKKVTPSELAVNPIIQLAKVQYNLSEFIVSANDDKLIRLIKTVSNNINKETGKPVSKVYFSVETEAEGNPSELIESYFNGYYTGRRIDSLKLKNGRVSHNGKHQVLSFNTTKLFSLINVTTSHTHIPLQPFQMSRSAIKKHYDLKENYTGDTTLTVISFIPKDNHGKYFSGEVWIRDSDNQLLDIRLKCDPCEVHPFVPLHPDEKITDAIINVHFSYYEDAPYRLKLAELNYDLGIQNPSYFTALNFTGKKSEWSFPLSTKAVLYAYDYQNPFLLPFYKYSPEQNDYRKISFIPYNEDFWRNGKGILLTEEQQRKMKFFEENGVRSWRNDETLTNSKKDKLAQAKIPGEISFEFNNIYWSADKRITLSQSLPVQDTVASSNRFRGERYNLDIQILLDINEINDSLTWHSATVFDIFRTNYALQEEKSTNCFINLLFDLYEIERRRMVSQISPDMSKEEIIAIYELTTRKLESIKKQYLKETETGRNLEALAYWNEKVKKELEIDNMDFFEIER